MLKDKGGWLNLLLSQPKTQKEEETLLSNLWEKKKTYLRDAYYTLEVFRLARSDKNKMKLLEDTDMYFEDWVNRLKDYIEDNYKSIDEIVNIQLSMDGFDASTSILNYLLSPDYKPPSHPSIISTELLYLYVYYAYLVDQWAYDQRYNVTARFDHVMTQVIAKSLDFCHSVFAKGHIDDMKIRRRKAKKKKREEREQIVVDAYSYHIELERGMSFLSLAKRIKLILEGLKRSRKLPVSIKTIPSLDSIKRYLLKYEEIKRELKQFDII